MVEKWMLDAAREALTELDELLDNEVPHPDEVELIAAIIQRHYEQASRCPDCQTRGSVSRTTYKPCGRCGGKGRIVL